MLIFDIIQRLNLEMFQTFAWIAGLPPPTIQLIKQMYVHIFSSLTMQELKSKCKGNFYLVLS